MRVHIVIGSVVEVVSGSSYGDRVGGGGGEWYNDRVGVEFVG